MINEKKITAIVEINTMGNALAAERIDLVCFYDTYAAVNYFQNMSVNHPIKEVTLYIKKITEFEAHQKKTYRLCANAIGESGFMKGEEE